MSRIEETFKRLKEKHEAALVSYLTAGDPSIQRTYEYASVLIEGGTDILELGIPFSDPIADGPVIQAASSRALEAGTRPRDVLNCAKKISSRFPVPIVLLSYYNPILKIGISSFLQEAQASGVDGLVVPDLPLEETEEYSAACHSHQIDAIFLATPTTERSRLTKIATSSSGFLYLVSVTGVTGERDRIAPETLKMVEESCRLVSHIIPVAVGFGISKPEHIRELCSKGADGVIIGSALVKIVSEEKGNGNGVRRRLLDTTREFKEATKLQLRPPRSIEHHLRNE